MLKPISFPIPLPDDPRKWDGWSRYNSPDPYERLCLDPRTNPSNELIEERFRELLLWWQKKLPLKNQPSNPLAQLLRSGLDESSRFLTEARVELLNPERRRQVDEELAAQAEVEAVAEFNKYVVFALNDKTLSPQEEETLLEFGRQHGLSDERMLELIEAELRNCGGVRVTPPPPEESTAGEKTKAPLDPKEDFMRMLRLSGLDADDMTDDQRKRRARGTPSRARRFTGRVRCTRHCDDVDAPGVVSVLEEHGAVCIRDDAIARATHRTE